MFKKIAIGALLVVLVLGIGLFFWVRSILGTDTVRTALAAQLSKSLGQPVTIGSIAATVYPRVTVNLNDVRIGQPPKIKVSALHVGTDFRALLSRRIEHASLNLAGARIELPLPDFAIATSSPEQPEAPRAATSASSVEIASIDEVVLSEVEIVSGGRTLRGNVEVVPQSKGLAVRKISLGADNAKIEITGQITDLSGPSGDLAVSAVGLNFDDLIAFVSDFSGGAGLNATIPAESTRAAPPPAASRMNLTLSLGADRATFGALTIDKLLGKARLTPEALSLEPVNFGVFGGKYDGTLSLSLGGGPEFRLIAQLSGVDVAAATAFAGSPNTISGRLAGDIDITGRGLDAPSVMKTARGKARVEIADGTVKNLGLVQTVVIATSGRADAKSPFGGSRDEPFSRLGGTLTIAGGSASTTDLTLEAKDVLLAAGGALRLDGSVLNFQGQVQLSDELSKEAGRDLVRYTQERGRVTLPVTITGSASNPQIRIDVASLAKRAITNRAKEEAQKAIKKGLGGLLQRK